MLVRVGQVAERGVGGVGHHELVSAEGVHLGLGLVGVRGRGRGRGRARLGLGVGHHELVGAEGVHLRGADQAQAVARAHAWGDKQVT